jgi:hypothetical protein
MGKGNFEGFAFTDTSQLVNGVPDRCLPLH